MEKLKKRLENGMIDESDGPTTSKNSNAPEEDESVLLLTQDKRTGLVMPARSDVKLFFVLIFIQFFLEIFARRR